MTVETWVFKVLALAVTGSGFACHEFYTLPTVTETMKKEVYEPLMKRADQSKKVKSQEEAYNLVDLFAKAYATYLMNNDQDLFREIDELFKEIQNLGKCFKRKKCVMTSNLKLLTERLAEVVLLREENDMSKGAEGGESQQAEILLYEEVGSQAKDVFNMSKPR